MEGFHGATCWESQHDHCGGQQGALVATSGYDVVD